MSEFQPLIDELYREEIDRARRMTPQQRLKAACELTDLAFDLMMSGIRWQHPDADDAEVLRIARERIAIGRKNDNAGLYRPVPANE
jgi:hypothetical protein